MCVGTCHSVCVCGGQRSAFRNQRSLFFHCVGTRTIRVIRLGRKHLLLAEPPLNYNFETRSLIGQSLPTQLGWLVFEPQGSTISVSPVLLLLSRAGIANPCHRIQHFLFHLGSGGQTRDLMFTEQAHYQHSSPQLLTPDVREEHGSGRHPSPSSPLLL